MPKPAAPSRASISFSISFGMLNIPVAGYTSTEEVNVRRSQFLADGTPVGSVPCVKNDDGTYGEKVSRDDIVKRFQTSTGLVELSDDEIDSVTSVVPGVADLLGVVQSTNLASGAYVPNGKVWQIRAAKLGSGRQAKPNPGGERAYALMLAALKEMGSFALLRFSRAGTQYLGALLPTGNLVGLYFADEVREMREIPALDTITDAEITLARQLLGAAISNEDIVVENDAVAKVVAYAEEKAATGAVVITPAAQTGAEATVDLMAVLEQSMAALKATKKPAAKKSAKAKVSA